MDRKLKLYSDILTAVLLIENFTADVISFEQYASDSKTKSAVERQLAIIGEAVTKLKKIDNSDLANARKIIDLRNFLVHSYDSVDDSIIWSILKKYLEPLKQEVTVKLDNS